MMRTWCGSVRRCSSWPRSSSFFDAAQVAGVCVLRGAADTRVPALIASLAYMGVGVPAAYLLGFHTPLGPVGIWVGLCLALATAAVLLGARARRARAPGPRPRLKPMQPIRGCGV